MREINYGKILERANERSQYGKCITTETLIACFELWKNNKEPRTKVEKRLFKLFEEEKE